MPRKPIAASKNLLLCAPTGTGKTLAAFLPILGELLRAPLAASVRCLYVAPLKALGNDVRKNLRRHLRGIRLPAPAEAGTPLTLAGKEVGRLTSPVVSPSLGPIGLALVRREAAPGARVGVGEHGNSAQVVELPFAS